MSVTLDSVAISSVAIPTVEEASVTGGGGGPPPPTGWTMEVGSGMTGERGFLAGMGGIGTIDPSTIDGETFDIFQGIEIVPGIAYGAIFAAGGVQIFGGATELIINATSIGGGPGTPPGPLTFTWSPGPNFYEIAAPGIPEAQNLWTYLDLRVGLDVLLSIEAAP